MPPPSTPAPSPPPPYIPSLPPELWIRILTYNADLTHLWTTCRQVSQSFRAFTEQAFADTHLRHTAIHFHLDKYNLGGSTRRPEVVTTFTRFSSSRLKERVYFAHNQTDDEIPEFRIKKTGRGGRGKTKETDIACLRKLLLERWRQQVQDIRPECPNYVIQIGDMVNDTELPGLELDEYTGVEISFEWRRMLDAFFREQERMRRLADSWVGLQNADANGLRAESSLGVSQHREVAPQMAESRRKVAAGEMTQADQLVWSAKLWAGAEKGFRKAIRRARLKAHYRGNEEMVWAIASMEHMEGPARLLKDVPGGRVGERWFQSMYLPEYLLMDEWSSLQRIDSKAEMVAMAQ
ncbi:uncharacterized protein BDZ99DRAFT_457038 [Mytilinidion resinicola]|uniref:F-box domain-containing protein n=1 Tax=Mytilinidion resinicola TaxID=574789 RepID=A0A6A6ZAP6_9PEZI|nr:uncharacterized protein BDZ99DRAFT_457038 [Mytilinidion resinicola]KAF2817287.1 hypothetical protein BDZ99DRAFT_457038 [Mytilinidion resinicola]